MIIKGKVLENLFKKATMGDATTDEGLLEFAEKGLYFKCASLDKTRIYKGFVKQEVIKEYKAGNEYGVRNLKTLGTIMSRFSGEAEVIINEENTISFKTKTKEIISKLADKETLEEIPDLKIEYEYKIKIKSDELKDFIKDLSIFKDTKNNVAKIQVSGKVLTLTLSDGNDTTIKKIGIIEEIPVDLNVSINSGYLLGVINMISADFTTISIKDDYPLKISENLGNYNLNIWFIAPRIEDEEPEKKSKVKVEEIEEELIDE